MSGWEVVIVMVAPATGLIPDDDPDENGDQHYLPIWLIEVAMGDALVVPLDQVRGRVRMMLAETFSGDQLEALAQGYLELALHHPDSPVGFGIRPLPEDGADMMVVFRGDVYLRDGDGLMTPQGWREASWPTREQWGLIGDAARRWHRAGMPPTGAQP